MALSIRIILRNVLSLLHSSTNRHNYHVLMAIEFPGWEQTFERVFVYEKIVGDGLAKR